VEQDETPAGVKEAQGCQLGALVEHDAEANRLIGMAQRAALRRDNASTAAERCDWECARAVLDSQIRRRNQRSLRFAAEEAVCQSTAEYICGELDAGREIPVGVLHKRTHAVRTAVYSEFGVSAVETHRPATSMPATTTTTATPQRLPRRPQQCSRERQPAARRRRSSAASGDSGSGSDEGPGEPPPSLGGHETCPACGGVLVWAGGQLVCPRRSCGGGS
jgi:hypothetical protein